MAVPDLTNLTRVATEANPDTCAHVNVTTRVFEGYLSTTYWTGQGQTTPGQSLRFESLQFANTGNDPHVVVGDYIRLESGAQQGEYRKVVSIVNNSRVQLASAFSVDQGPVDFGVFKQINKFDYAFHKDELWDAIDDADKFCTDQTLLKLMARQLSSSPGTRAQVINKINANPIDIKAV